MKDKLLFGTIGLLVGIVVMQWTMPLGQAEVVTDPVGNIVAQVSVSIVVGSDGAYWNFNPSTLAWEKMLQLPIPLSDVHFIESVFAFVDKNGDLWEYGNTGQWVNRGQPPIAPLATEQSTWGKIKSTFSSQADKP